MTIHLSILAWRIPWTEDPWGRKKLGTTEQLSAHTQLLYSIVLVFAEQQLESAISVYVSSPFEPPSRSLPHQVLTSSFLRPFAPSLTFL